MTGSAVDAYGIADPELTARIIQNVISNCVRYAENRVEAFILTEKEWSVVVIEDDGPGFSKKDVSHLFERFYHGAVYKLYFLRNFSG